MGTRRSFSPAVCFLSWIFRSCKYDGATCWVTPEFEFVVQASLFTTLLYTVAFSLVGTWFIITLVANICVSPFVLVTSVNCPDDTKLHYEFSYSAHNCIGNTECCRSSCLPWVGVWAHWDNVHFDSGWGALVFILDLISLSLFCYRFPLTLFCIWEFHTVKHQLQWHGKLRYSSHLSLEQLTTMSWNSQHAT